MSTFSKRFLPILGLLFVLLLGGCEKKSNGLTVVFPKLGAADCAIFMTEEHTVVIDTGETEDAGTILDVLSDYHRDSIDLLVISHYDKDHVGGAAELMNSLTVHRVIGSSYPKESEEYDAYQTALSQAGLTEELLSRPETVTLSKKFTLTICPPEQAVYPEDESNNASVAVAVQYGSTRMLFTGDAMEEKTQEILSEFSGTFDLIKLPHHGRETDTAALLSDTFGTDATAYVVTSSKKEPEHKKLQKAVSGTLYRTRDGAVTAFSDGTTVKITQSSEENS